MITLGQTLKTLRERIGISQVKSALQFGTSRQMLDLIEKDAYGVDPELLESIYEAWGIDLHMAAISISGNEGRAPENMKEACRNLREMWTVEIDRQIEMLRKEFGIAP